MLAGDAAGAVRENWRYLVFATGYRLFVLPKILSEAREEDKPGKIEESNNVI